MASTQVKHAPRRASAPKPENPKADVNQTGILEDRLDYISVRQARALASKRNEKPTSWQDFKKKLAR